MNCKEALPLMHEHMDGDLDAAGSLQLKRHLLECPDCRQLFRQMETTEAMLRTMPAMHAPADMTSRIMRKLPPVRRTPWYDWFRSHPAASVAAGFILVMLISFVTLWDEDRELLVKGPDLEQVVIKGDTVYVPAGHKVAGNLTVQSGKLQVDGEINGNIVIIDGSVSLASTAHISGHVTKIDEAFEWMWFKINEVFSHMSP